ncbi:nucleotide sugar dehydrogenase [Sarocladium strictum]
MTALAEGPLKSKPKGGAFVAERQISWASSHGAFPITPPISDDDSDGSSPDIIHPDDDPVIAVLGVGYVGSHLVSSFSAQYGVIGFDVSPSRIRQMQDANTSNEGLQFSCDPCALRRATHFLISVPTLLRDDRSVDSSYLQEAIRTVGTYARQGATVVVESSVAVGMTRELLGPLAKARGFFAGMSPERVDPGRVEPPMRAIPKIISGLDDLVPGSLAAIQRVYEKVFDNVVCVSRPEVAEMTKLYENCQRMVCIAYANEMADACTSHGIDPYEVSSAAATKPFGYMSYTPSLGVGGHCIPVNPFYLLCNSEFPLLEQATATMWNRPKLIAQKAIQALQRQSPKSGDQHKVLVVGMAFKAGQSSLSNSPGVELVSHLASSGKVAAAWADPLVAQEAVTVAPHLSEGEWRKDVLESFDMIIVSFRQHGLDFGVLDDLQDVQVESWC